MNKTLLRITINIMTAIYSTNMNLDLFNDAPSQRHLSDETFCYQPNQNILEIINGEGNIYNYQINNFPRINTDLLNTSINNFAFFYSIKEPSTNRKYQENMYIQINIDTVMKVSTECLKIIEQRYNYSKTHLRDLERKLKEHPNSVSKNNTRLFFLNSEMQEDIQNKIVAKLTTNSIKMKEYISTLLSMKNDDLFKCILLFKSKYSFKKGNYIHFLQMRMTKLNINNTDIRENYGMISKMLEKLELFDFLIESLGNLLDLASSDLTALKTNFMNSLDNIEKLLNRIEKKRY